MRPILSTGILSVALVSCAGQSAEPQAPTSGRLPAPVIQAIVRQHYSTFKRCYDVGIASNPKLGGRVQIRFVITERGTVEGPTDDGSELSDKSVVACIANEFLRMTFPRPEGGSVTVVYPVMLAPG